MKKQLVLSLMFCLAATASAQPAKFSHVLIEAATKNVTNLTIKTGTGIVTARTLAKEALPSVGRSCRGLRSASETVPCLPAQTHQTDLDFLNHNLHQAFYKAHLQKAQLTQRLNNVGQLLDERNKLGYEVSPQIIYNAQTGAYSLLINGELRPVDAPTAFRRAELLDQSLKDEHLDGFFRTPDAPEFTGLFSAKHAAGFAYLSSNFYQELEKARQLRQQVSAVISTPIPLGAAGGVVGFNAHYADKLGQLQGALNKSAAQLSLHTAKLLKFLETARHQDPSASFGLVIWDYTSALGSSPLRRNFWD